MNFRSWLLKERIQFKSTVSKFEYNSIPYVFKVGIIWCFVNFFTFVGLVLFLLRSIANVEVMFSGDSQYKWEPMSSERWSPMVAHVQTSSGDPDVFEWWTPPTHLRSHAKFLDTQHTSSIFEINAIKSASVELAVKKSTPH